MKSKDYFVLKKIIEYSNQVDEAVKMFGNEFNCFTNNSVYRNACCMCILQIGELCKLVSSDIRNEYKNIPWRSWCGIRDIFAHQYSNLDLESAWETITTDLPNLKTDIIQILNE